MTTPADPNPPRSRLDHEVFSILAVVVGVMQLILWVVNAVSAFFSHDPSPTGIALLWIVPIVPAMGATWALVIATHRRNRAAHLWEVVLVFGPAVLLLLPAAQLLTAPWSWVAPTLWGAVALLAALVLVRQPVVTRAAAMRSWWKQGVALFVGIAVILLLVGLVITMDRPSTVVVSDPPLTTLAPSEPPSEVTPSSSTEAPSSTSAPAPSPPEEGSTDQDPSPSSAPDGGGGGVVDAVTEPEPEGRREDPCAYAIGEFGDSRDVPAISEAFVVHGTGLDGWAVCGDGPVEELAPGRFRQLVRSQSAGPAGWLIAYYDATGQLVVSFIPPQVGQVIRQQAPGDDWSELGFPHAIVGCGPWWLQTFWDSAGALSAFALWSYDPAPSDAEPMEAWIVPVGIARSLVDRLAELEMTLVPALGEVAGEPGARQMTFPTPVGVVVEVGGGDLVVSELTGICPPR